MQRFNYVVATRKLGVAAGMARRIVRLLCNFEVVTVTTPLIDRAIELSVSDQISFWDALIVAAAAEAACEQVWTEDLQHGQSIQGLTIVNALSQH